MADLNIIKPAQVQTMINKFCYTIGMLPTSYKASLTYEEQILAIGNYLETLVYPAINNNAEALTELQGLFIALQDYVNNYFDNLDVQEEINNKLDDMAESGELEDIIAAYINTRAIFGYDTVADMTSAKNLDNGSYAKTLGYYAKNDGGAALYKIRTITNEDVVDGSFIIAMTNENLIAELIIINDNINMLGAYGDNIHDDTEVIEKSLNKLGHAKFLNKTYKCNINIDNDEEYSIIGLDNTILNAYDTNEEIIKINNSSFTKKKVIKNINMNLANSQNGIFVGLNSFVDNYFPNIIELKNIHIYCENSFSGNAIELDYLREFNIENITVKRARGDDSLRTGNGLLLKSCMNLQVINSSFGFLNNGIKIENGTMSSEGIKIDKTEFFFNNNGVNAQSISSRAILDLRIENCMVDQIQQSGLLLDGITSASISNCWLGNNVASSQGIYIKSTYRESSFINIINNTLFMNKTNDGFGIKLENNTTNNIRNITITNNQIYDYKNYGIKILGSLDIRHLIIANNNFGTSSADTNKPFNYETAPTGLLITNNYNAGANFIDNDIEMHDNINMVSNKEIIITTGSTVQNNTNRPLQIMVNAYATTSGTKGRIVVFMGQTLASVEEKATQLVSGDTTAGSRELIAITIPPQYYYAINPGTGVTIQSAIGFYM